MVDILWAILWTWGEAFLRWLHVIAGIGWIGSSFYFIHLDYSLKRREGLPPQAYGEAWQVHGGGILQHGEVPGGAGAAARRGTWFKWEAYATWVSGFALLVAIYYFNAGLYLVSPEVLDVPPAVGIALSLAGPLWGGSSTTGCAAQPSAATRRCWRASASPFSPHWRTSQRGSSARAALRPDGGC